MSRRHVVLGASGVVGRTVAAHLERRGISARTVGRGSEHVVCADLSKSDDAKRAVEGADVVHFAVGLPYETEVWLKQFPPLVRNVLDAMKGSRARLVFLDNVYMYGKVEGPMTESVAHRATTKKGVMRRQLVEMVQDSGVPFVIARSADFYGPGADATSVLNMLVLAKIAAGETVNWLENVDRKHSFTYTHDIADAMVRLADASDVVGTTWHVPTASPAPTVRELTTQAAALRGRSAPQFQVLDTSTLRALGEKDRVMDAIVEMLYQYDSDYVFDSSAFERRFGVEATSYEDGMRATLDALAK